MTEQSTIAAIATGTGGGIGILRISGPRALEVAAAIFRPRRADKSPLTMAGYTGALGRVVDRGEELDEAVLFVYRAPHSYTGEDGAELCCHGGRFVLEQALAAAVAQGARPAAPGEFTKRAYLNGKMSLTQAESVADIIAGESRQAVRAALRARDGALFRAVMEVADRLMDAAAHISAWIDYPEEDVEAVLTGELSALLEEARGELSRLAGTYRTARLMREGVPTAIVGGANVGKSTLMNLLAGCQRSIVTDIPGTTRDVVRETVRVGDAVLDLSDTAGIRETDDPVERIGVERSRSRLESAELVLAVLDGSRPLSREDRALLQEIAARTRPGGSQDLQGEVMAIALINKSDLPQALSREEVLAYLPQVLEISARDGHGLGELEAAVARLTGAARLDPSAGMVANQRQLDCVARAEAALAEGAEALAQGQTLDAVSVCLEEAIDALLELTGQRASAQVVDRVFEQFCVGK